MAKADISRVATQFVRTAFEQQMLLMTSAQTIFWRSFQFWNGSLSNAEFINMWSEKPTAFALSYQKAILAMLAGKGTIDVLQSGLKPLSSKSAANARRLRRF